MRRRVEEARVGRLASVRPEGGPHVVPCCFVVVDGVAYSAIDAKPKSSMALRRLENVRATPAVSLLVDQYGEDWSTLWWVRLDGNARVIASGAQRDRALVHLCAKYEQYVREPPPGPVIAIDITGWRAWP